MSRFRFLSPSSHFASTRTWMACLALLGVVSSARAQDTSPPTRQLDDARVVDMATASHPTLKAALLELRQSDAALDFEKGRYPYILQVDGGVTRTAEPTLLGDDVSVTERDSVDIGTEVSRTFPTGTRASLRVEGYRDMRRAPTSSGPAYGLSARASVTQPLMRGAGTEVGESELRVAQITASAARLTRDRTASEISRDVLLAYWELWYAETSVGIEESARDLAKRQRDEAKQRAEDGALAPVEVLPFETRVASLEEGVVSAETTQRQRSLTLVERIGAPDGFRARPRASLNKLPAPAPLPPRTVAVQQAQASSPEIRELSAQLRLAQERVKASGDSFRPRLDLEAYVQVAGLGNRSVPPAFEQVGTARATSAHVGFIYELPLDSSRENAERSRQLLAVKIAEQRLRAARQRIQSEVESVLEEERAARRRLELATQTVTVAEKQVKAETERFDEGVAIPIQVQEAEDQLRQARLRGERARVDVALAGIRRAHLTGDLLRSVGHRRGVRRP